MLDLNDKKISGSAIKLNSADNVAVALSEIKAGTNLLGTNITTREIVPPGYKVAICDICLLYTSPSPRDLSTSRMPSSA